MIITVRGEALHLLPERALFWPSRAMLVVADIHFGKAAAFRAQGIPVPHGTTTQNLDQLDGLIRAHPVRQIVFLGDFLHARASQAPATLDTMREWRARCAGLRLTLIRGNHDLHAGDPPSDLDIEVVDEPYRDGPFAFSHHPQPSPGSYVLAGHLHPVARLSTRHDSLRLPCFAFKQEVAILPSFGAFTGGHLLRGEPGQRLFVTADDKVFEISQD